MDSSEVVCKHTASLRESEAHHGHMSIVTTFCQLSPHSVAWLLAFMIRLGIVVRGRVQVPSLNAGINSGGLIWVGTCAAY